LVKRLGGTPATPHPLRQLGISNTQAKELARLERQLGLPYSGRGMTARLAAKRINNLRRQLE